MFQECLGCHAEFCADDAILIGEDDGGPVCFACLTAAEDDLDLLDKLESAGVDLD
mgnify:CR=1 FL=1